MLANFANLLSHEISSYSDSTGLKNVWYRKMSRNFQTLRFFYRCFEFWRTSRLHINYFFLYYMCARECVCLYTDLFESVCVNVHLPWQALQVLRHCCSRNPTLSLLVHSALNLMHTSPPSESVQAVVSEGWNARLTYIRIRACLCRLEAIKEWTLINWRKGECCNFFTNWQLCHMPTI